MHAVNLLNAEDGGNRTCIMVTNNEVSEEEAKTLTKRGIKKGQKEWEELGIAKNVTWPRTVCSIEGKDINGKTITDDYISLGDKVLHMSDGFVSNVKYCKCEWVPRVPEEENLTELLMSHIREMIELEYAIEIDGSNYLMVLTEAEADQIETEWDKYNNLRGIFISHNVLLTTKQNELFNTVTMHTIPDYYFDIEMKEVGETW